MQSFVKIKSLQKGKITLSATDIGESYPSREIFRSKVSVLMVFAKNSGFTVCKYQTLHNSDTDKL